MEDELLAKEKTDRKSQQQLTIQIKLRREKKSMHQHCNNV